MTRTRKSNVCDVRREGSFVRTYAVNIKLLRTFVYISVFILFSLNDIASKCTWGINFSVFILVTCVAQGKKRRQQGIDYHTTIIRYSRRENIHACSETRFYVAREDAFARISLVLPEFRQSKATSAARIMSTIANSLKVALWRPLEKMSYRLNLNILISQRRASYFTVSYRIYICIEFMQIFAWIYARHARRCVNVYLKCSNS